MTLVRLSLLFTLSVVAIGCGTSYTSPTNPSPGSAPGASPNITILSGASGLGSRAFNPNPDTIAVGTTLTWTNSDAVAHTSTADGGAWNSGPLAAGGTFSVTMQNPGTFTYHCSIHSGMTGTIVVQ